MGPNCRTPRAWLEELNFFVTVGQITQAQANEEVFAEMAGGNLDAETETLYYWYTQGLDWRTCPAAAKW